MTRTEKRQQYGMVLLTALLMLLMITSVVIVNVHQVTLGPRTLANAELKNQIFYDSQSILNQVSTIDLQPNSCPNQTRYDPYNPLPTPQNLDDAEKVTFNCTPTADQPRIQLITENTPTQRSVNASGANQLSNDYYTAQVTRNRGGISSSLRQSHYKTLWRGGETGINQTQKIDITIGNNSNTSSSN
ncbi:hypothetical protein ACH42_16050 [Endozoicomonas sp. (ex Bugula neritina AB1)]|nr:hypothetical protein ACH42_16050 [Endozoicomonas sp. (ex Bugula neritina AB1)]